MLLRYSTKHWRLVELHFITVYLTVYAFVVIISSSSGSSNSNSSSSSKNVLSIEMTRYYTNAS